MQKNQQNHVKMTKKKVHVLLSLWLEKLTLYFAFLARLFIGFTVKLVKKQKHYFAWWIQNPHSTLISLLSNRFSIHKSLLMLAGLNCPFCLEFKQSNVAIAKDLYQFIFNRGDFGNPNLSLNAKSFLFSISWWESSYNLTYLNFLVLSLNKSWIHLQQKRILIFSKRSLTFI
jgi:hypothetical protein